MKSCGCQCIYTSMGSSFFVTLEMTSDPDSTITLDPVDGEIKITDNDGWCI